MLSEVREIVLGDCQPCIIFKYFSNNSSSLVCWHVIIISMWLCGIRSDGWLDVWYIFNFYQLSFVVPAKIRWLVNIHMVVNYSPSYQVVSYWILRIPESSNCLILIIYDASRFNPSFLYCNALFISQVFYLPLEVSSSESKGIVCTCRVMSYPPVSMQLHMVLKVRRLTRYYFWLSLMQYLILLHISK